MKHFFRLSFWSGICIVILAGLSVPSRLSGQVPPLTTEDIFPPVGGAIVYRPIYTSAYSFHNVDFRIAPFTYIPQDLYVYSFNGENYVSSGIAWYRRDPGTNAVIDQGYISVPTSKWCMNVGIVKDAAQNVYVIVAYLDYANWTAAYDLYMWDPAGLPSSPTYTEYIGWDYLGPNQSFGGRISMDCFDLKQVAFTWDEYTTYDEDGEELNPGGIFCRVLTTASPAPFTASSSSSFLIDGTGGDARSPDVAIGMYGGKARVAFIDNSEPGFPTTRRVRVVSEDFLLLLAETGLTHIFPFTDYTMPSADYRVTSLFSNVYDDHIHIDCPDYWEEDLWSMVYSRDYNQLQLVTRPPSGTVVNLDLTIPALAGSGNYNPVVAYGPSASHINVGWYSQAAERYVAVRMANDGTGYLAGTTYFNINFDNVVYGAYQTSKLAFNRMNNHSKGLFMAYPIHDYPAFLWGDMRTKTPVWAGPPLTPFSMKAEKEEMTAAVSLAPNPVTADSRLFCPAAESGTFRAAVYDVSGRLLYELPEAGLEETGRTFGKLVPFLAPGNYLLRVAGESVQEQLPFTKL